MMRREFACGVAVLCALSSFAALRVQERDGRLSVLRDGQVLVAGILPDRGAVGSDDVRSSFAELGDGTRVWNRWSEDPGRRFRLEVAARADGAVEITLMGEADAVSDCRRRMLHLDLPDAALLGKPYRRVSNETSSTFRAYGEEDGTFTSEMKEFFTRFLASDGVVYDFNPLGPGDESGAILWSDAGNQLNNNGVGGYWRIARREGGFRFSCGGDIAAAWGGFAGGKVVVREGAFADFDRLHANRTFFYPLRLQPTRLVSFGAPARGEKYADGDCAYDEALRRGWLEGSAAKARRTVVGHPEGALYSCVAGTGGATYRLDGLVDGWHVLTFSAGNYTGLTNRFSLTANGEPVLTDATVPKGSVRRVSKAVHVRNGRLDVGLDGAWIVSAIGDQALLAEAEDFSVSRGFWMTDGYEPCTLFRNADTKAPFVAKLRDETDVLPVPGTESAAKRRAVPMPVERPTADDPRLAWAKTAKMARLLGNSVSMSEFGRPGSLEAYVESQLLKKGIGVVMLSGMHSRHTYLNHVDRGIDCVRHVCDVLHRYGIKVIDHHDSTLLWNIGSGFRVMMERLDETAITRDAGLPSWQFCPSNRKWTATYCAYLRKLVEAGVDGLQIDELEYWSLGCRCHDCREAFRRDTGWEVPLNECDAAFNNPDSMLRHVWHDWRKKALTNWFVGLRRYVKDLRDDFILSCYTTNDAFCCPNHFRYVASDMQDLGRTMNYFGSEMMSRSALRDGRNLLSVLRMRAGVAPEGVPPLWIWWYNVDYANEYFAWALSALVGQTPLLSDVSVPVGGAQFEAFGAGRAAMDRDGAEPVAEVAILFPTYSRDWNSDWKTRAYRREMFGTAQTLDAMHIPYEFISDSRLESGRLDKFRALFVGEAQCLSDAEIAAIKAFAARGGKVRMTVRAGTRDELGTLRAGPAFGPHPNIIVTEETRAAPFEQWETWNTCVWDFNPDKAAEAAFRHELLDWCGGARTWKINAPDKVFTGVWREKSGDCVVHFINATGVDMKPGEKVVAEAPDPAYPPLRTDMSITAPASVGTKAVAVSPDFSGEVALAVRANGDGTVTAVLPKERLAVYTLVRFAKSALSDSGPVNKFQLRGDEPVLTAAPVVATNETVLAPGKTLSSDGKTVWWDGSLVPLEGRGFKDVMRFYDRMPARLAKDPSVRRGVWSQCYHSSGECFRFHLKGVTSFKVRWSLVYSGLSMGHMPSTGVSGLDLYLRDEDGKWRFARNVRPSKQNGNEASFETNGKDAMVYLPLYNGPSKVEFGVPPGATFEPLGPRASGVAKPVVFYGTSITHGGCCSRPGLSFPAIVCRRLDAPLVNLGFSGNGRMELAMADYLAAVDASCYVLDCLWNMSTVYPTSDDDDLRAAGCKDEDDIVRARYEPFVRRLRQLRPEVPIVFAELCDVFSREPKSYDRIVRGVYEKLLKEGWKNLHYVSNERMYTGDGEGTVDGCHPNDWGMFSLADAFEPAVRKALFGVDENVTAVLVADRGKAVTKAGDGLVWIDGETLPLEGKPFANADTYFSRLPSSAKSGVVQGTWMMGRCSPGMSYVFRTDARKIRLRWSLTSEHLAMSHMPATGVSGLDLYVLGDDGKWAFRKCCIPRQQHDNEVEVTVEPGRTYRLYLPLFNGIARIAFGLEKGRTLAPVPLAPGRKPIVFYGGSVAQGACVTRPGNAWVNVAGRKLDWPTVCMGFNGQGRMTLFEAELLAKIDAAAYGFLCFGNMDAATGKETCLAFLRRLHELRPDVPIALGAFHYVLATGPEHAVERGIASEVVRALKAEDPASWANLTVVPVERLCPADCDGSVDGGHPNDYGAQFMAEGFVEALRTVVDRPYEVLMVGNSFSESVLVELPKIARAAGRRLALVNLMIGGCSLEKHWANAERSAADPAFRPYVVEVDWEGETQVTNTPLAKAVRGRRGNLQEIVRAEPWDLITIQQASFLSTQKASYQPWAGRLVDKLRELAPQAEIRVHQTWSYNRQDVDPDRMFAGLKEAYGALADENGFKTIPTGEAVQLYRAALPVTFRRLDAGAIAAVPEDVLPDMGGEPVGFFYWNTGRPWEKRDPNGDYRLRWDSNHLNPEGKYLQGLVWYASLFKADPRAIAYKPEKLDVHRAEVMRAAAHDAVSATPPAGGRIAVGKGEKIAFLGDSITEFGSQNEGGYVNLVMHGLSLCGVDAVKIPAGVSGNKSNQMLARLHRDVLAKKPDWMVLSCGVNDVGHGANGVELEPYKTNITAIVDQCQASGVKVIVATPTLCTDVNWQTSGRNRKLEGYCEFLRALAAERKLPLADLNRDERALLASAACPKAGLTFDHLHMNGYGNVLMAKGVLRAMGLDDAQLARCEGVWRRTVRGMQPFGMHWANWNASDRQIPIAAYEEIERKAAARRQSVKDFLMARILELGNSRPDAEGGRAGGERSR